MHGDLKVFTVSLMVVFSISLVLVGCGGGDSLSGVWLCEEHFIDSMVGKLSLEFNSDGTFSSAPVGGEGTYEMEGNTVVLNSKVFNDLELQMEGNKLVASSSAGDIVYVKQ